MIGFRPKSTLAFIVAISLVVYYGISTGNQNLQAASETVLILSAIPFAAFVILAIVRNIASLIR